MKRRTYVAAASLIAASMLVACGPQDQSEDNNANTTNNANNTNNSNNTNNETNNATNNTNNATVTASVSVSDQEVDLEGPAVEIDSVGSPSAGWIVLHEDDGGSPGGVVGKALVAAGETDDVRVLFERDPVDGELLHAMLHVDEGVQGTYEFPDGPDVPVLDEAGAPIAPTFTISVPIVPAIAAADQTLEDDPALVTVASVTSDGPGWVAIYSTDGQTFLDLLGTAAVPEGDSTDVTVALDRDAVDAEVLFAALHVDAGEIGVFEGPTEIDTVVTVEDDTPLAAPFTVTVPARPIPAISMTGAYFPVELDEVVVDSVTSDGPGWVVVREIDSTNKPSTILGWAPVPNGDSTDVTVSIDRPLFQGVDTLVQLFSDLGDEGVFEVEQGIDVPVLGDDGEPIADVFDASITVDQGPSFYIQDQVLYGVPNEVVIQGFVWSQDAFVWATIHGDDPANNTFNDSILGATVITGKAAGAITVKLTTPLVNTEKLWFVLHEEAGGDTDFDFPGPDVPYVLPSGETVALPFVATPADWGVGIQTELVFDRRPERTTLYTVETSDAGYVAIHDADPTQGASQVLGYERIREPKLERDLFVSLSRDAVDGETLFVVFHEDTNRDGIFDYPNAEDVLMRADGSPAVTPMTVRVTLP